MNKGLYNQLIEYSKNGKYPFHMPGHKRNEEIFPGMNPVSVDITEINGFDNLHQAEGILQEAMDNAAEYFGTKKTWFLVNGSTCGILAALYSVTQIGDEIVIGRNCHKSVYNAAEIRNLAVHYLYPENIDEYGICGGYNPDKLERMLRNNGNIKAVVITSPTYEGIVSDVKAIADITHRYGAVLIVDEAHGAHFIMHSDLPEPAYRMGADLVIESVHKTLPSFTQTALLHLSGDRVESEKIQDALGIYETSSPSYLFMGSIDRCIRRMQSGGEKDMADLLITVENLRNKVNKANNIYIPGKELVGKNQVYDVDLTRLDIFVDSDVCDGKRLADILREEYGYEMEMCSSSYVIGITTVSDEKDQIIRLEESLVEIDKRLKRKEGTGVKSESGRNGKGQGHNSSKAGDGASEKGENKYRLLHNQAVKTAYEAKQWDMENVLLEDAAGRVSGQYLYLYPPGIPLIVPGEIISEELVEQIKDYREHDLKVCGLEGCESKYIKVLK